MKLPLVIVGALMMAAGIFVPIGYFIIDLFLNLTWFDCCCGWMIYAGGGLAFLIGLVLLIVGFVIPGKPKPAAGPGPPPPPPPSTGSPPPPPPPK